MSAIIARLRDEPAVFWGSVAALVIAVYHVLNPAGDKDSLITDVVTTLGPIVAGFLIRPQVTPT